MADTARQSEAILAAARASLADQRAGGRRMGKAIGTRSAALRRRHTIGKIKRITAALLTILIAAFAAGLVLDGIGFTGLMLTGAALVASLLLLARYPRLSAPQPASLTKGPVAHMVGTTQLWLESQRPALPPPAQTLVGQIGHQLDLLALQLDGLDDTAPAAGDVRRLIGEYLPLVVNAYAAIPVPLRQQSHAGTTPNDQLSQSLTRISSEIDSVTRQLADGALDHLAIQTRFLDYKYGNATPAPALNPPD